MVATKLEICNDSQLIVWQIQKEYGVKDERMTRYLILVEDRLKKLDKWTIIRVSWAEKSKADTLVRKPLGSTAQNDMLPDR